MGVFIAEPELGRRETDMSTLRSIVRRLPFESAILHVAVVLCRLGSRLNDPHRQWEIAKQFYASQPELLADYEQILTSHPDRVIFSPQPLMLLMRLLLEHARHEPLRDLAENEIRLVQDAVLGAHSAIEVSLDAMGLPTRDAIMAYELQAATFFRRDQPLEEMARHYEFLRLATADPRLMHSVNRVPVAQWLAEYGITAEQQWALGFGLSAITHAFDDPVTPRIFAAHVDDLLTRIGLTKVPRDVPAIASSRSQFNAQFGEFGGGEAAVPWELRPFTSTPFLRLTNGDLLLLSPAWLLSWLGEGFHYRALRRAQEMGPKTSGKYQRFAGESWSCMRSIWHMLAARKPTPYSESSGTVPRTVNGPAMSRSCQVRISCCPRSMRGACRPPRPSAAPPPKPRSRSRDSWWRKPTSSDPASVRC